MRLTIHDSLSGQGDVDLEVVRGASLREVVAGFPAPVVWCASVRLGQEHVAGDWPLVAGAVLSARPLRPVVSPMSLHLATIAGPDAGVMIPLDAGNSIGSAPPSEVVRDDAIDAHHVTVSPPRAGALRIRDTGTVNGTGVWASRAEGLSWRGRRRTATVHVGDVIAIGRTLMETRHGPDPRREDAAAPPNPTLGHPTWATRLRNALSAPCARAMRAVSGFMGVADRARVRAATDAGGFPDPTRTGGWSGPIAVQGDHAVELSRAVILARGRRPPPPMPLDEPWLEWLPPALDTDGHIRIGPHPAEAIEGGWSLLTAEADRTTSRIGSVTRTGPVVRVHRDTADALARMRAGERPDPPCEAIHWADAAGLDCPPPGGDVGRRVVAGLMADSPATPWAIPIGASSHHTLIAGAPGAGKTTLLATLVGALALTTTPTDLALVILCAGEPGVLEPYLDLPHVRASAINVRPGAALRIVEALDADAALTVVVADDIDALGPDGRAVTERLEAIAVGRGQRQAHVVMSTRRPTAVLTPTLRAALGTAIALRTATASDSIEVIGIDAAAALPIEARGAALVRSGGRVERVRVALPFADGRPRIRRCDAPDLGATTLAAAALRRADAMRLDRQRPRGLGKPAS